MSTYKKREKARLRLLKERERISAWNKKNRDKIKANIAARKQISLTGKKCVLCGSTYNLHRHHRDYSKPLEADILCQSCHNIIHNGKLYTEILNKAVEVGIINA